MFKFLVGKKKQASQLASTVSVGCIAEKAVGNYLEGRGWKVIGYNWKTRQCEIDLIAEKGGVVFFVEVKYRKDNLHGAGFDYITPVKLKKMSFAAELWVSQHNWEGDYALAAAEVEGSDYRVINFVEI